MFSVALDSRFEDINHEKYQTQRHRYRRGLGTVCRDLCVCRMQYDSDKPESEHRHKSFARADGVYDAISDALTTNSRSSGYGDGSP